MASDSSSAAPPGTGRTITKNSSSTASMPKTAPAEATWRSAVMTPSRSSSNSSASSEQRHLPSSRTTAAANPSTLTGQTLPTPTMTGHAIAIGAGQTFIAATRRVRQQGGTGHAPAEAGVHDRSRRRRVRRSDAPGSPALAGSQDDERCDHVDHPAPARPLRAGRGLDRRLAAAGCRRRRCRSPAGRRAPATRAAAAADGFAVHDDLDAALAAAAEADALVVLAAPVTDVRPAAQGRRPGGADRRG